MKIPKEINNMLKNYKKYYDFSGYKLTCYGKLSDIEDKTELKKIRGAYIMLSDEQEFVYPNGNSKICYIGKSENLYSRLNSHRKNTLGVKEYLEKDLKNYFSYDRYCYMYKFGANVYVIEKEDEFPENLEYYLLDAFYCSYYAFPVGNNQGPKYREK